MAINTNLQSKRGFTLIELMVVIAIIGLLASIILTSLASAKKKAQNAQIISEEYQIRLAMELYYNQYGGYPNPGANTFTCIGGTDCEINGYTFPTTLTLNDLSSPSENQYAFLPVADAATNFSFDTINTPVIPGQNKGFIYLSCTGGTPTCPIGGAYLIYALNDGASGQIVIDEAVGIWQTSAYTYTPPSGGGGDTGGGDDGGDGI